MNATDQSSRSAGAKPTVVLVHGAFADGSSWNGVIERLQKQGYTVIAPANPLRGVAADAAYTASLVGQIDGPVLLAGHSYGGAVISNAATSAPNVVGLVFVAAFAPDEGERLGDVASKSTDSILGTAQVQYRYPAGPDGESAVEFGVDPALLREVFAADLPAEQAALLAATQRPVAAAAFSDVCGPPAWRKLPCWAVIATGDKAAGTDITRAMAQRAGAEVTEVDGSHVIMISQPEAVAEVIVKAAEAAVGARG
ncbi:MAG TPA: alpha/beta hydrolase [Streptosporangiaceae bacterium]|nr:alpha/beta hydrolase [Streptosporangiaceae bacterium]